MDRNLGEDSVCACFAVRLQNEVEMSLTLKLNISQTKLVFAFPRNCDNDVDSRRTSFSLPDVTHDSEQMSLRHHLF